MECKARLVGVSNDYLTGNINMTFATANKSVLMNVDSMKDIDIRLNAKKWAEKRSLDANAYFHVLVGKLSDKLNISKIRCKNILIARYGQQDFLPDGQPVVIKTNIPTEYMYEQETLHTLACNVEIQNGKEIIFYKVYRGSHTYDSKEMNVLINGVVEECKEQGIETITPVELRRLTEQWQRKSSQN